MLKKAKIVLILLIFATVGIVPNQSKAVSSPEGKIFLQVEAHGEAWYVSPVDHKRYFLGRPEDAYSLMREMGLGISNANLALIPIGVLDLNGSSADNDRDGLSNDLEIALGTDPINPDSDDDDYSDKEEITNGYNPLAAGKLPINNALVQKLKGRILLQVEKNGEAWYLSPVTLKRYFLGRASDAFNVMRKLGQGITNSDLLTLPRDYSGNALEVDGQYKLQYPSTWTFDLNTPSANKEYITSTLLLTPDLGDDYLKINTFEYKTDKTLSSFKLKIKSAPAGSNISFYAVNKPGQKIKYSFDKNVTTTYEKDKFVGGAIVQATIMVNTKKFIQATAYIHNSQNINYFEEYLNDILNTLQPIY